MDTIHLFNKLPVEIKIEIDQYCWTEESLVEGSKMVSKVWRYNGAIHRDYDLPAVIQSNGTKMWYQHGKIHREGKPAVIWVNGTNCWYKHGLLHREEGKPARTLKDSTEWYENGLLHREGGEPAKISKKQLL